MKVKTSELTEYALDWAAAKCEGYMPGKFGPKGTVVCGPEHWGNESAIAPSYSTDWAQGGPIIEREKIGILPSGNAYYQRSGGTHYSYGSTPLIAAMRCYVASKLGDEVDVPEELV